MKKRDTIKIPLKLLSLSQTTTYIIGRGIFPSLRVKFEDNKRFIGKREALENIWYLLKKNHNYFKEKIDGIEFFSEREEGIYTKSCNGFSFSTEEFISRGDKIKNGNGRKMELKDGFGENITEGDIFEIRIDGSSYEDDNNCMVHSDEVSVVRGEAEIQDLTKIG